MDDVVMSLVKEAKCVPVILAFSRMQNRNCEVAFSISFAADSELIMKIKTLTARLKLTEDLKVIP